MSFKKIYPYLHKLMQFAEHTYDHQVAGLSGAT